MRALFSEVDDYIAQIKDADLLAAIIFNGWAEPASFRAAVRQFVRLKGVDALVRMVDEQRRSDPLAFRHTELAILSQLLRSPFIAIKVAFISKNDKGLQEAEGVLEEMKKELVAAKPWDVVYRKFADLNPDTRERAENPFSVRTLICYQYDGVVSPSGFDILTYSVSKYLPPLEHLQQLFRAKQGTHVIRTAEGVYLYHIGGHPH
jgi:hypothetical protein